jgi:hypothetical protein
MKPQAVETANAHSESNGAPDKVQYSVISWMGIIKSVNLDRTQNTITFENCFVPRQWFAVKASLFQCSLDDIVVVYAYRDRVGKLLKIITISGTVEISERNSTGFAELSTALAAFSEPNRLEYPLENPALGVFAGLVYFGGALVGLIAGLCCVPRAAGAEIVALILMCGGVCGLMASKLLIVYAYLWWQVELIKPLGYGLLGAALALFVGVKLGPNVAWDWRFTFLPIPLAFLGGVVFGMMLNRRRVSSGK